MVLIILAVVTINLVLGEDGLIRQAEQAKDHQANGIAYDEALVESLDDKIANAVAEPPVEITEEFLKEKLSKESGDSAIDEYGNIVSLSLWNTEPIDSTTCKIVGWMDAIYVSDTSYSGYRGNITGGQIDGNIPVFVKKDNTIYKVVSIGDYTFINFSDLESITIPDNITSIGESAFYNCSGLTSITIPNSVTSIGNNAFHDCSSLTSVTIGNSVTSLGDSAFYNCSSLTSVTIPNSVTSIGYGVFSCCSNLTTVTIDENNTKYDSRNNCNAIIETASNTLIQGCATTTIPDNITSIGEDAFREHSNLVSITIPDSVASIGVYAFNGCSGLTSITIPDSVTSIGYGVFYYCSNLTTVTIDSSTIASSIAYDNLMYTTTIYIKDTIAEESIGSYIISNYNEVETKDGYVKYTIKTSN